MKNNAKTTPLNTPVSELEQLKQQLFLQDQLIAELRERNEQLQSLIDQLQFELKRYRTWNFGPKSEQMTPEQLSLFEATRSEDLAAIEQLQHQINQLQPTTTTQTPAKKPTRQPLPAQLKRVEILHLPQVTGIDDIRQSAPLCQNSCRFLYL